MNAALLPQIETGGDKEAVDVGGLHVELQKASTMDGPEQAIRAEFRRIVIKYTGGVGAGHVIRDADGRWDVKPDHVSGRVPRRQDFVEKFGKCCEQTVRRNSVQIEHFLGLEAIYVPVNVSHAETEVLLALTEKRNATKALFVVEIIAAYFGLWIKSLQSTRSNWKLSSIAAIVELVSDIERCESTHDASQVVVNELARLLGAQHVGLGLYRSNRLGVTAISGTPQLDKNSDPVIVANALVTETTLRNSLTRWPPADKRDDYLLLAHRQLADEFRVESVLSIPLMTPDDKVVGVLFLTGAKELIHGDRLPNFARAAAVRIASAINVVRRAEGGRWTRVAGRISQLFCGNQKRTLAISLAVIVGLMACPVPYRIRCHAVVEATSRRFAVAPFQGTVERGHVRAGDNVQKGQLLVTMDAQPIRLELASTQAKRMQAKKRQEIALAERRIPDAILAGHEVDELTAQAELLRHQADQVEIRSPVDGVILSGSLERTEAAAVKIGDVLFEVGPLDSMKIEAAVPADEISQVRSGHAMRVWTDGGGQQSIAATVDRIRPRSDIRDMRNVFVVEAVVANSTALLRPGMKARVRIDGPRRPLVWTLFHKPLQAITARLAWW